MALTSQLAKHLRDIHFGGNWTVSHLKAALSDLSWEQATKQVHSFNTIATLSFHSSYYVAALLKVLEGEPLQAKDEYSFNHPPIHSQEDWEKLMTKIWEDAEKAALLIEQLPDSILEEKFTDEKYGTYYRNIQGIIEHMHYHLGQIALIKKILADQK